MKWIAGAVIGAAALARAASPPFSVSVETSWPAPPLVLEILETVHDENPAAYFPLLKLLTQHASVLGPDASPESVYKAALDLVDSHALLPLPGQRSTLELALALHTAAPRIEAAYSQYAGVDEAALGVSGCGAWVEWRGKGFCDVDSLRYDVERLIEEKGKSFGSRAPSQPLDHASESPFSTGPQAVLYYTPSTESLPLVEYLSDHARNHPNFQYVVRYRAPAAVADRTERTPLSGYGVEMQLKNTDYLVVDDRVSGGTNDGAQATFSANPAGSNAFVEELGEDPWAERANPLTEEETADLGLKAINLIKTSSSPLDAMVDLTADLPKYAARLARRVNITDMIRKRVRRLSVRHPIGPAMFINGKLIIDSDVNAFGLLKSVRQERNYMNSLLSLGYTPAQAYALISDPIIGQSQGETNPLDGLVDASDRPEGGDVIGWMNNLENDVQYQRWPQQIRHYLRPVHPGQLHLVRRNTFNVITVLDLTSQRNMEAITHSIATLINRQVPIRIGIVPMLDDIESDGANIAKVFFHVNNEYGSATAQQYFSILGYVANAMTSGQGEITTNHVKQAYERLSQTLDDPKSFDEILADEALTERLAKAQKYTRRLSATKKEWARGHYFVNGKHNTFSNQWTQELQGLLGLQLGHIQTLMQNGVDVDEDTISTFFYDQPTTTLRRNKWIVPASPLDTHAYNLLDVFSGDAEILSKQFIYPSEDAGAPLTTWVIGDLDSVDGRNLVHLAVANLQSEETVSRLGFVHVPGEGDNTSGPYRLSTLLYQLLQNDALQKLSPAGVLELLEELDDAATNHVDEDGKIIANAQDSEEKPLTTVTAFGWSLTDAAASAQFWNVGKQVAARLNIKDSKPHILVNGRLIGPIEVEEFAPEDFISLEVYELGKRVTPIIDLVRTFYDDITVFTISALADLLAKTSSVIASSYAPQGSEGIFTEPPQPRSRGYEQLDDGEISFNTGNADTALLHIAVIVDPMSEHAQRWSPLVRLLSQLDNVAITVYLDANMEAQKIKVNRFYRAALRSTLTFDIDGNEIAPAVTFNGLPSTPIFTLGMETPSSWILQPKKSHLDLDNLLLGRLSAPTHVHFDLKQLAIDGHGRESGNVPPRGLQMQLLKEGEVVSDTQVMANLGYMQFKATPGVYDLAIRPGRGAEVFEMISAGGDGWNSPMVNVSGSSIALAALDGVTIYPRYVRRPGMEKADVLQDKVEENLGNAVWSRMKGMVGLSTEVKKAATRQADINIFTVASGLLYERFASIMILSVMKHTKSTVKFWFIENFLSPTFINFLPHLSKEYGFDYELVTYKWPNWLRAQTEKQRIIWAYKILFLDVLFPMDLDKVIFVDADQIVRVDMKELVDVDLHGHVYGYPPMGDDRTEMEGFRFWKTGYWKDELRGRPYHISALYVVDLKRFRQLATGDRLRQQYHALSADPNSLANLDQDLPNSMQTQIPIWTLDQDWLWCQTWCSDESLARAKTIDLCQNPLTKEPKLVRARQIPEWDVYDREIAAFAATLETDGGALAANVDDLASTPGGAVPVEGDKIEETPKAAAEAEQEEAVHDEL